MVGEGEERRETTARKFRKAWGEENIRDPRAAENPRAFPRAAIYNPASRKVNGKRERVNVKGERRPTVKNADRRIGRISFLDAVAINYY